MPLIKDDRLVEDPWVSVGDEEPLPEGAPAIVGLARWQAEAARLRQRNAPLGVRLRSDQSPNLIAEDLDHFALVALEFPKFTDGRAYSYARLLRERYGYRGELRAVGAVLRDQALFLVRCGFDAFEVAQGTSPEAWAKARAAISVRYQPATDGAPPAYRLRQRSAGGAPPDGEAEDAEPSTRRPDHAEQGGSFGTRTLAAAGEACAAFWAY